MRSIQRLMRSRLIRAFVFIFAVWNVVEVHYISRNLQQGSAAVLAGPPPGLSVFESRPGADSGSGTDTDDKDSKNHQRQQEQQQKKYRNERRWQHKLDGLQQSLRLQRPLRVYIASIHWNNEAILRSHWNAAVLDLVRVLGPSNVFVAVHEGGSWDKSADAIRELDADLERLGVQREIVLDRRTHWDEVDSNPPEGTPGWIETPRGKRELRRIPYLAGLRNRAMRPLRDMAAAATAAAAAAAAPGAAEGGGVSEEGRTFDRVLFLNDVVFTVDDALTLLATNEGHYAAACSLDFSKPPNYYDTFALRDADGHEHATQTWPYFRSARSRHAMKLSVPVPVRSCWNGMVAMPARIFTAEEDPLSFRGIPDSLALHHLEGSECCLIHADNPLSPTRGVFLNPNVRVGYNGAAYEAVHPADGSPWLSSYEILSGLWRNRLRRLLTTPAIKEWKVRRVIGRWSREKQKEKNQSGGEGAEVEERVERGWFCLINEMQVLVANGWAHV